MRWKQSAPIPAQMAGLIVRRCVPTEYQDCDIIFSGLNSDVAGNVEMAFLKANFAIFSNAKTFRLAPLVPLIVPVVNPGHIESIPTQRRHYQVDKGLLVCNSNCALNGSSASSSQPEHLFKNSDLSVRRAWSLCKPHQEQAILVSAVSD